MEHAWKGVERLIGCRLPLCNHRAQDHENGGGSRASTELNILPLASLRESEPNFKLNEPPPQQTASMKSFLRDAWGANPV